MISLPPDLPEGTRLLLVDSDLNQVAAARFFPKNHAIFPGCDLDKLSRTDLNFLAGWPVTIWPTAGQRYEDQAEALAAQLHPRSPSVKIVRPNGSPDGFCVASEYFEVITDVQEQAPAWAREHLHDYVPPESVGSEPVPPPAKRGKPRSKRDGSPPKGSQVETDGSVFVSWERLGLQTDSKGNPYLNLDNIVRVLNAHPAITGRIWYDDFHSSIYSNFFTDDGTAREWTDNDDNRLEIWLQTQLRLPKVGPDVVRRAANLIADINHRNELTEWLDSLEWDGTERLRTFLSDVYGTNADEYHAAVGRCWLVSMVARAYLPGCKADYLPVLEGPQGLRKSSSLAALGGKFYLSLTDKFGQRDFLQSMDGGWLVELADMSNFRGADLDHVKAVVTTASDRYCRRYARRAGTYPRRSIFAASANNSLWQEDTTGGRRFWPFTVEEVNLDFLRDNRDQLFAEARALFMRSPLHALPSEREIAGSDWWRVPVADALEQQAARRAPDTWERALEVWLPANWEYTASGLRYITMGRIFEEVFALQLKDQEPYKIKRLARLLNYFGLKSMTVRLGNRVIRTWCCTAACKLGDDKRSGVTENLL